MEPIYGVTFAPFARRGEWATDQAKSSLQRMVQRTGASHVVLVPAGMQDTPQSEGIAFRGEESPTDTELVALIEYAQSLGLQVILKPTVNCRNGVWRAYINFFDNEVPCEPKWGKWFASHKQFQLHYARIAQRTGCCMFIAGCEMVMAQRREAEWRALIAEIRAAYSGPISYNTDKYQEEHVCWWDCVDVISSSGYYPSGAWEQELNRIETVVRIARKPFFFAEVGCMPIRGASGIPNDWNHTGEYDEVEQADWYREMFAHTRAREWVSGYGLWDWPLLPQQNTGYSFCGKAAETIIHTQFSK